MKYIPICIYNISKLSIFSIFFPPFFNLALIFPGIIATSAFTFEIKLHPEVVVRSCS